MSKFSGGNMAFLGEGPFQNCNYTQPNTQMVGAENPRFDDGMQHSIQTENKCMRDAKTHLIYSAIEIRRLTCSQASRGHRVLSLVQAKGIVLQFTVAIHTYMPLYRTTLHKIYLP